MTCLEKLDYLTGMNRYQAISDPNYTICAHIDWIRSINHYNPIHPINNILYNTLLISASRDESIRIWDPLTSHCLSKLNCSGGVNCLEILTINDNKINGLHQLLFSGISNGSIEVWSLKDLKLLKVLKGHNKSVISISALSQPFTLNKSIKSVHLENNNINHVIATGAVGGKAKIWDWIGGVCLFTINCARNSLESIRFIKRNEASYLFVTDLEQIKIWNVGSRRKMKTLSGHTDWVRCIEIVQVEENNTLNTVILTAGDDKTIRYWVFPLGRCLKKIEGHCAPINLIRLMFYKDILGFYTLDIGGSMNIWSLKGEKKENIVTGLNTDGFINGVVVQIEEKGRKLLYIGVGGMKLNRSYHFIVSYKIEINMDENYNEDLLLNLTLND